MPDNVKAERPDIEAMKVRAFHNKTTRRDWQRDLYELVSYIELLEGERIVSAVLSR